MLPPSERLHHIQTQILGLLDEARKLIQRNAPEITWERAKSYWFAQAQMAITDEHEYIGSATFSMDSAIQEMEAHEDENASDKENEDDEDSNDNDHCCDDDCRSNGCRNANRFK